MRLIKQKSRNNRSHLGFISRPFEGQGVSLYVTVGDTAQYRDIRIIDGNWIRGAVFDISQTPVPKTPRIDFATSPATSITVPANPDWEDQTIAIDIRTFKDDVENESYNYRLVNETLVGADPVLTILGTATLLDTELRDGGVVRLRFIWSPPLEGLQPTKFTAIRAAGPTSPANVDYDAQTGRQLVEIDTVALSDSAPYTYKITATNGAVVVDILTGIVFTADATGPDEPVTVTGQEW